MAKPPKTALTIYKLREGIHEPDEYLKAPDGKHKSFELGGGQFHAIDSKSKPPDWARTFFRNQIPDDISIFSASTRGIFAKSIALDDQKHTFIVSFGQGRHLINKDAVEERFGLRVVLNSCDTDRLRSIDKTTLGSSPKMSREQLTAESGVGEFGVDIAQDLVSAIAGRSKLEKLGKVISGRDAIAVSVADDFDDIDDLLTTLCQQAAKDEYRTNGFEWIDQIKHVKNSKLAAKLDEKLLDGLTDLANSKVWMSPPELVDWHTLKGFKFRSAKTAPIYADIDVYDFWDEFGKEVTAVDDLKKKRRIIAVSAKNDEQAHSWSAYKCCYAEVEIDDNTYVLTAGKWYQIQKTFRDKIVGFFDNFPVSDIKLIDFEDHGDEGEYNKSASKALDGSDIRQEQSRVL